MLAYHKIALRVGISERSVRENIKKLVEQGYLVESNNWFVLNFDCEFIKYIVKDYMQSDYTQFDSQATECAKPPMPMPAPASTVFESEDASIQYSINEDQFEMPKTKFERRSARTLKYHSVLPSRRVEIAQESISKFRQMFGNEAEMAMDFFKNEVLKKH